jgi:uncharacterized protein YbjT (DUF2867 family)
MRASVTGATGFVGGRLARHLRERGDSVAALVRSPAKAASLRELGCELVEGDLEAISPRMLDGSDAVFHCAAVYEIGARPSETSRRELGYAQRDLATGMADTVAAQAH